MTVAATSKASGPRARSMRASRRFRRTPTRVSVADCEARRGEPPGAPLQVVPLCAAPAHRRGKVNRAGELQRCFDRLGDFDDDKWGRRIKPTFSAPGTSELTLWAVVGSIPTPPTIILALRSLLVREPSCWVVVLRTGAEKRTGAFGVVLRATPGLPGSRVDRPRAALTAGASALLGSEIPITWITVAVARILRVCSRYGTYTQQQGAGAGHG